MEEALQGAMASLERLEGEAAAWRAEKVGAIFGA